MEVAEGVGGGPGAGGVHEVRESVVVRREADAALPHLGALQRPVLGLDLDPPLVLHHPPHGVHDRHLPAVGSEGEEDPLPRVGQHEGAVGRDVDAHILTQVEREAGVGRDTLPSGVDVRRHSFLLLPRLGEEVGAGGRREGGRISAVGGAVARAVVGGAVVVPSAEDRRQTPVVEAEGRRRLRGHRRRGEGPRGHGAHAEEGHGGVPEHRVVFHVHRSQGCLAISIPIFSFLSLLNLSVLF